MMLAQDIYAGFYKSLGYTFTNEKILKQALTRKSNPQAVKQNGHFQTLEWLGDCVLGLAVADLLREFNPNATEGDLTTMKARLVNNKGPLARVARFLGLEWIIIKAPKEKVSDKQLSDHMEAILGAIFIDTNKNYTQLRNLVALHWKLLGLNEDNASVSDYGGVVTSGINNLNLSGETQLIQALFKAIVDESPPKMELILQRGVYIETKNEQGLTPLFLAFQKNCWQEFADILIHDYRANVDVLNPQGLNLLHICAQTSDTVKLEYLLANFAEIDFPSKDGSTALHYAAAKGHLKIIQILIEYGATIDILNKDGKPPIFYVTPDNQTILTYLQQAYDKKYAPHKKLFSIIKHTPPYELRQKKEEIIKLIAEGIDIFNWHYEQKTIFKMLIALPDYVHDLLIDILTSLLPIPDINLSQLKFTHKIFKAVLFIKANLSNTDFTCTEFKSCNFSNANLAGSNLSYCKFYNTTFADCDMTVIKGGNNGYSTIIPLEMTMDENSFKSWLKVKQSGRFSSVMPVKIKLEPNEKIKENDWLTSSNRIIDLSDVDLSIIKLSEIDYGGYILKFNKTTLSTLLVNYPKTERVILKEIDLRNVDLSLLELNNIDWERVYFDRTTLLSLVPQIKANKILLKGTEILSSNSDLNQHQKIPENLDQVDLSNLNLSGINFGGASFIKAKLSNSKFIGSSLWECNFREANVTNIDLTDARLDCKALQSLARTFSKKNNNIFKITVTYGESSYIDLSNLNLTQVDFRTSSYKWVNFQNTLLRFTTFSHCSFEHVDFRHADLSNADLSQVQTISDCFFDSANLCKAKLSAKLFYYLLSCSNLFHINLREINCQGLSLTEALPALNTANIDLEGANFDKVTFDIKTLFALMPFAEKKQINLQDIKIVPSRSSNSTVYSSPQFSVAEVDELARYARNGILRLNYIVLPHIMTEEHFKKYVEYAKDNLIKLTAIKVGMKRNYHTLHTTIASLIITDLDMRNIDLSSAEIHHIIFRNVNLSGCIFKGAHLQEVKFENCIGLTSEQLAETAGFSVTCDDKSIITRAMAIKSATKQSLHI